MTNLTEFRISDKFEQVPIFLTEWNINFSPELMELTSCGAVTWLQSPSLFFSCENGQTQWRERPCAQREFFKLKFTIYIDNLSRGGAFKLSRHDSCACPESMHKENWNYEIVHFYLSIMPVCLEFGPQVTGRQFVHAMFEISTEDYIWKAAYPTHCLKGILDFNLEMKISSWLVIISTHISIPRPANALEYPVNKRACCLRMNTAG